MYDEGTPASYLIADDLDLAAARLQWIEKCNEVEWRKKISSLNILLTSTVWRQVSRAR